MTKTCVLWATIISLFLLALCVLALSPRLYLVLIGILGVGALINVTVAAVVRLTEASK